MEYPIRVTFKIKTSFVQWLKILKVRAFSNALRPFPQVSIDLIKRSERFIEKQATKN